jgi:hypothetical protein
MRKGSAIPIGAKIGAMLGFIGFLVLGIVPGFYFGSSTAILLMSKLMGPVEATAIGRIAVVMGALIGLFCAFSVFLVCGALFGVAIASLTDMLSPSGEDEDTISRDNRKGENQGGVS